MEDLAEELAAVRIRERRLVIAIDYGTTFTGVAYATPAGRTIQLGEIDLVDDWGPQMGNSDKIPSIISYSPSSQNDEQQWGASLAEKSVAMVNTKLELKLHTLPEELDLVLQAMDGMKNLNFQYVKGAGGLPEFPWQGAEEIVTDYLTKVFGYLLRAVAGFSEELRDQIPVDIVVTVPTDWSYEAKNSTYRAITAAGFKQKYFPRLHDMILISEPEAAAVYTARYLKELDGEDFLKVGEHFVLCDAGGGTVDVVSYRVTQLEPVLELELVGKPTGEACGSVFIDQAFKIWLKSLIGAKNYAKIDPGSIGNKINTHAAEGGHMRELMKNFDAIKRRFKNDSRSSRTDLTGPLKDLTLGDKVVEGQFTITNEDMKSFFDPSIDEIVEMIKGQIGQIMRLKSRVKNVFLIGGFATSKYLQSEVELSLKLRGIKLRVPDTCWSAVVRGAVIHGVEKERCKNLVTMKSCPLNYGICLAEPFSDTKHTTKDRRVDPRTKGELAVEQMIWLIKKGDLMLSDDPREIKLVFDVSFTEASRQPEEIHVYSYEDEAQLPERLENARQEMPVVHSLRYDLTNMPLSAFVKVGGSKKNTVYIATLEIQMSLNEDTLSLALSIEDNLLDSADVLVPAPVHR